MLIYLRQSGVRLGSTHDHPRNLKDAAFMKIEYAEAFDYGVEFLPSSGEDNHQLIEKTDDGSWLEPNTGIVYEFLEIRSSECLASLPKHLELTPPVST